MYGRGVNWQPYEYLKYIALQIQTAIEQGNKFIIINLPPRHGKSTLISKALPAWFLSEHPEKFVIATSYSATQAANYGKAAMHLYQKNKGLDESVGLATGGDYKAKQTAVEWETERGGGMFSAGVGGSITGRGGHLLLLDDPIKNIEEARSETYRRKVIDWFQSTFSTRLEPNGVIIIIMTRWHKYDLAGWLLSDDNDDRDDWQLVNLPAIALENDPVGRAPGEALCPARYPLERLEKRKLQSGAYVWESLYQGNPISEDSTIFNPAWWQYYDAPPRCDITIQSWDFTHGGLSSGSSYVCGQTWGKVGNSFYLLDQKRIKAPFSESLEIFKLEYEKWRPNFALIEQKVNGVAIVDVVKRLYPNIVPIQPKGSKTTRAIAVSPIVENGNVYLPRPSAASWISEFLRELSDFPSAKNDDQVDALTQGISYLQSKTININTPINIISLTKDRVGL